RVAVVTLAHGTPVVRARVGLLFRGGAGGLRVRVVHGDVQVAGERHHHGADQNDREAPAHGAPATRLALDRPGNLRTHRSSPRSSGPAGCRTRGGASPASAPCPADYPTPASLRSTGRPRRVRSPPASARARRRRAA